MSFMKGVREIGLQSLPLIQRLLLSCDGTLTDTLEAIFLEPICLTKIGQEIFPDAPAAVDLELKAEERVMVRKVLLVGEKTSTPYVYAETILAIDRLSPELARELQTTGKPIGKLLQEHRLEGRRGFLSMRRCALDDVPIPFASDCEVISRRYSFICGGSPLMIIKEFVPSLEERAGLLQRSKYHV
jgi:chorismate-pyruvate lyase